VGAILLVDCLLLTVWSGVSPLQPILFQRATSSGAIQHITLCAPAGKKGMSLLAIQAVFKSGLLILSAILGFSTRKVALTFNESSGIGWATYNTVLAAVIVALLVASIQTVGDTLIWLVTCLVLWISFCTYAFLFLPKAQGVWNILNGRVLQASNHSLTQESSLSLEGNNPEGDGNLESKTVSQLQSLAQALQARLEYVRRRIHALSAPDEKTLVQTPLPQPQPQTQTMGRSPIMARSRLQSATLLSPHASSSLSSSLPPTQPPSANPRLLTHTSSSSSSSSSSSPRCVLSAVRPVRHPLGTSTHTHARLLDPTQEVDESALSSSDLKVPQRG
jgi:hypothetical protein